MPGTRGVGLALSDCNTCPCMLAIQTHIQKTKPENTAFEGRDMHEAYPVQPAPDPAAVVAAIMNIIIIW